MGSRTTVEEAIDIANEKGVDYWEAYEGGHRVTTEEYYSIKIDAYKNYRPVFKAKKCLKPT